MAVLATGTGAQVPVADSTVRRTADDVTRPVGTWQGIVGAPPVQLSTSYIRLDLVDKISVLREINTGPGGMYSRMEELGHRVHFEESITCRLPTAKSNRNWR